MKCCHIPMMSTSGHCPVGQIWMALSCVGNMSATYATKLIEATGHCYWASIHSVLHLQQPGSHKKMSTKSHHFCLILHTLPNRGGPGLQLKPLDATIGQILQLLSSFGHTKASFFKLFHFQFTEKEPQMK